MRIQAPTHLTDPLLSTEHQMIPTIQSSSPTVSSEAINNHSEIVTVDSRASEIGRLTGHLDTVLGENLPGSGRPGHRPPDVMTRMLANAEVLHNAGFDTPEKCDAFAKNCWTHDATLAGLGLGVASNLGYELGMTSAAEVWAGLLPKEVLSNPNAFGTVVGLAVGGLDVAIGVVGGAASGSRILNGRCDDKMPPSIEAPSAMKTFTKDVLTSTLLNYAKNSVRVLAPPIQNAIEGRGGFINRDVSDRTDVQIDGGGGFISNGIDKVLKLNPGTYTQRLVLRDDLKDVIDKTNDSWGKATLDVVSGAARGAKALVTSPVPVAIALTIGGFINTLFASNSAIDRTGSRNAADGNSVNGTFIATGEDGTQFNLDEDAPYEMMMAKRASSTAQMGNMTSSIPLVATMVDALFDSLSTFLANCSAPKSSPTPTQSALPEHDSNFTEIDLNQDDESIHSTSISIGGTETTQL